MDRLEEHIRKNREDLDRYSPPKSIWRNIRRKIEIEKSFPRRWLSIAAMIVVILGTSILIFKPQFRWSSAERGKNEDLTLVTPQLRETESYYNNLINSLYTEAKPLLTNNPEIKKELNSDLSQLDSICSDLKKDLKDNVSNQDVVEALIQNYRIKISILEDMLKVLKENKNIPEKPNGHEL